MSDSISNEQLNNLFIAHLALAKSELSDAQFDKIQDGLLRKYIGLVHAAVPPEHLADKILMRHALHAMLDDGRAEEAIMHVFLLYVYKVTGQGRIHPLEMGIIKQRIEGLLPVFERSTLKGLIRSEIYDRNADALYHIATQSGEHPEILNALSEEYLRLQSDTPSSQ